MRRLSIVLPTLNGIETLPDVLGAIRRQRTDARVEIVAVDSGSTDGSLELMRRSADKVLTVAPDAFDHGLTRNLAIERTDGELVVLLVQDAVPVSDEWLSTLVAPFFADERVAGTFARQRPRFDASAIARYYLNHWVAAGDGPIRTSLGGREEFIALDPMRRFLRCAFDNVCSCIRRSVWQQIPFRSTPIAEDLEWARDVLLAGHRLEYVPDAVVVHSHDRSARYEFKRTFVLHRRLWELFGLRTIPTLPALATAIASSLRLHVRSLGNGSAGDGRRDRVGRALALAVAWPLGQYLGGLAAARQWQTVRFRGV